jgi:hypothetical protein
VERLQVEELDLLPKLVHAKQVGQGQLLIFEAGAEVQTLALQGQVVLTNLVVATPRPSAQRTPGLRLDSPPSS